MIRVRIDTNFTDCRIIELLEGAPYLDCGIFQLTKNEPQIVKTSLDDTLVAIQKSIKCAKPKTGDIVMVKDSYDHSVYERKFLFEYNGKYYCLLEENGHEIKAVPWDVMYNFTFDYDRSIYKWNI